MAASGTKTIGSAAWIAAEKENVMRLLEQEMEEVEFPVRHEMDWLNEHMAEIFSSNQFNMTELFKTPGKLRGKTPYTARKRNPDEARVPLSNIFSTANQNLKLPSKFVKSPSKPEAPRVEAALAAELVPPGEPVHDKPQEKKPEDPSETAEDPFGTASEKSISYPEPISYPELTTTDVKGKQPVRDLPPNKALNSFSTYNTDSGYHGLGDDDDELVLPSTQPLSDTHLQAAPSMPPLDADMNTRKSLSVDRRTTEGSFVSAQENIVSRGEPMDTEEDRQDKADEDTPRPLVKSVRMASASPEKPNEHQAVAPVKDDILDKDGDMLIEDNFDDIGSPSDGSTPAQPPPRKKSKSSLSFASLPPRDPVVGKKSMGARLSRTSHVETIKPAALGRQSYFTGHMEGPKPALNNASTGKDDLYQDNAKGKQLQQSETEQAYDTSMLHTKLNTQRLHDKISMLGKTQAPRATKSIAPLPNTAAIPQASYPELPGIKNNSVDTERNPTSAATAQEDWIKPLGSPQKPAMPKSQTADVMELVSGNETNGKLEKGKITRTETFHDLSDNRSPTSKRLIFSNFDQHRPASASTPPSSRRMESVPDTGAESTTPLTSPRRIDGTPKSRLHSIIQSAKSLFSSSASLSAAAKLETLSSPSASRPHVNSQQVKTSPERPSPSPERLPARVHTFNDSKSKLTTKPIQLEDPFERGDQTRPAVKVAEPGAKLERAQKTESKERDIPVPSTRANAKAAQPPQPHSRKDPGGEADSEPKFPLPPTTNHGQSQSARARPVKPTREVAQKPKPQPMSIRVGSTITRMPIHSAASYNQESSTLPAPVPATKKPSNSSLHAASSNASFKSSVSTQSQRRAQAVAAAEAKKQEDRDTMLRKEEQKKGAALLKQQQEEARRQERERSVAEENKKAAQRRPENTRLRQGSQPPKPANDLGSTLQQEKATHRTDMGPARPPSRLGSSMQTLGRSINQPPTNPAKPAKRPLDEEPQHRSQVSVSQAKSQPVEPKRRKTEDDHNQQQYNQAPSLKQNPIRKENGKLSLLAHAYPQAPPPAAHHHTGAMYKTGPVPLTGQPPKHAASMDMAQYTSGKIPFASNQAAQLGTAHKTPSHKTPKPGPSAQRVPAKPSPQYPPSESIHLPEPPTDSEEEDSDADIMPVANWTQGDTLLQLLSQQESWQADRIFGPIPEFELEDVFKNDRKIKKFRERTSSANWGGPDGLTQEEVARDLAARRAMRANGGWSLNLP
ncbi:conserved hypothetical protein [Talaromyces stipitatus ATCC 10500]|uniref:Inner centromere protein ARK-binding domain-containing protein n=1 Tax=Talaromyces stipitatus (strain ATCC 10500 / CBS 375.48 / QM 6759 / NRRL 1006) TaxID=441959 RepID=B8LZ88_TALSN|nr:uncharacterized protein TSTA_083640 [Talaromyces stipitatus ATCC 10500]EED21132.1 conserved hypothetical protein [Talaromyces stipitatus ATCC 10500]